MKTLPLLFTALWTALLLTPAAYAADITLSSSCTLADAIIAANNDRAEADCPAGRGADAIALTRDITLDGGLPKITSDIAIEGNGYTISGGNRWRIFYNDGGALTIHDLTMTKGYVEGDLIYNVDGTRKTTTAQPFGGAIVNWKGTVAVSNSGFSGNSAKHGGAIVNLGELSISDSSFSDNSAEYGGGAIYNDEGTLSISDSAFSGNSADWGGGAIDNWGELSISDSSFSGNSTEVGGGAIDSLGKLSISGSAFSGNSAEVGGAIYNRGELSIVNGTFGGNLADNAGGAIDNEGELSIVNSTFSDNLSEVGSGAIHNNGELSISDSSFSGNSAEYGGAIYNWGELSIVSSAFSGNSADESGGAIVNGGDGTLSISDSIFSHNSAEYSGGVIENWSELSITNSTFSDNSAEYGGGVIGNWGELSITNSTFSDNSADSWGGAIDNEGELSIVNSIIAGRGGNACFSDGELKRNISNFILDGTCSPALRGDPMLGELVEPEDGSPAYFPLLAGSRAIDAADDDYCPATDQIGTVRPQGGGCDIGAIEYVDD